MKEKIDFSKDWNETNVKIKMNDRNLGEYVSKLNLKDKTEQKRSKIVKNKGEVTRKNSKSSLNFEHNYKIDQLFLVTIDEKLLKDQNRQKKSTF